MKSKTADYDIIALVSHDSDDHLDGDDKKRRAWLQSVTLLVRRLLRWHLHVVNKKGDATHVLLFKTWT
jgi:hypothetical protein